MNWQEFIQAPYQELQWDEFVPCQPIRYDDGIPVYDSGQLELFGEPYTWGVHGYLVVELRETSSPMVTDYQMELERKLRPIHRYSRIERFTSVLGQISGGRGKIPWTVIEEIKKRNIPMDPDRVWNRVREFLKETGNRKYYNRITQILSILGFEKKKADNETIREIVNDFRIISSRFDRARKKLGRVYFPSLRFVAFKLLERHGIEFGYKIPFVRTPRKLKEMEATWALLL